MAFNDSKIREELGRIEHKYLSSPLTDEEKKLPGSEKIQSEYCSVSVFNPRK